MTRKIVFKFFNSKKDKNSKSFRAYRKITAKQIAKENGIDYISNVTDNKYESDNRFVNQYYAKEGRYISLHPANDGMPTCTFEWYSKFDGETKMILDNHSSFKCITNLSDIISQMIKLYTKYIDDEVFIASLGFAIKLEDEIKPDYVGRASFVLTDNAIRNEKVKPNQIEEAKKYFLNDFLDHFIGWNFGKVITSNENLEKELLEFNELVINKGLREYAGPGFDVWCSKDVQHYKLKTE